MIFSRSGRPVFPLLPPYGAHDPSDGRVVPSHPDGLTPYLGLRARLSQVWINRWTILLLLVLVRVLIAVGGVSSNMASAKREALSACTSVESMGSAMASMPHYLSQGVNELTASGIDSTVHGLRSMLLMTITGVEEIILFIIKIMYQTYLCLITMAVRGTVSVATGLIEDALDVVNSTLHSATEAIQSTVSDFESSLNDFAKLVNTAASALGADLPTLNLNSSLDMLDSITIPSNVDDKLNALNSSIPTFDEVQNFTETVIRTPFEEVKRLLNNHLGNYTFDRSGLPVPEKKRLTFCDDNGGINGFFDGVGNVVSTAKKIFIAVLVVAAILACAPMAWQEIRRWRQMKERSQLVHNNSHDPMDVVYIVSRPFTAAAGVKAASRFSNSRRQILVRWAIAYATSTPALFVLALAIAALFSCLCQYILLKAVAKTVPELITEVGAFADKVVDSLQDASTEWSNSANKMITDFDDDLNNNIFSWVNTTTHGVNETLNTFVDKTQDVLNETFGDTLLREPVEELFNCLIGLKIESVQKGLTWVSNHAHIDFPLLPNDTFSRGAQSSISSGSDPSDSFLADAGDETSNKISEVVTSVINKLYDGLRTEAIIATCILLLWVFIALIGVTRAIALWWGHDRNRGEGGGHAMDAIPNPRGPAPNASGADFTDVPLTAIPKGLGTINAVPQYENPAVSSGARAVPGLDNEKMGFAGRRDYQVDSAAMRKSNYVEYDMKH
ncbi:plasma membrane fusion protein prm1 [Penicillium argentinense]|uniref:Plasma membrane fusion protein PRM1 n=1 Tax=Penicillium argentinense TaxID=1131581 RepID=A0A9W9K2D5_9EURO|nr:plasma membrane fusion protein prm1 [Penicillium argentinense]KAJ5089612.1 plasma membrane fusion protein prm1 [Penicillium argentinense]